MPGAVFISSAVLSLMIAHTCIVGASLVIRQFGVIGGKEFVAVRRPYTSHNIKLTSAVTHASIILRVCACR